MSNRCYQVPGTRVPKMGFGILVPVVKVVVKVLEGNCKIITTVLIMIRRLHFWGEVLPKAGFA